MSKSKDMITYKIKLQQAVHHIMVIDELLGQKNQYAVNEAKDFFCISNSKFRRNNGRSMVNESSINPMADSLLIY